MEPVIRAWSPQRVAAFDAIVTERDYQDQRWGGDAHDAKHEIEAWLVYMRTYVNTAMDHATMGQADAALASVRKVAALAVAAMEALGAPKRESA